MLDPLHPQKSENIENTALHAGTKYFAKFRDFLSKVNLNFKDAVNVYFLFGV